MPRIELSGQVHTYVYVIYTDFNSAFVSSFGVPQGSNLAPLPFVLDINDLLSSLSYYILAYADGLKIYLSIHLFGDILDLQHNLNITSTYFVF